MTVEEIKQKVCSIEQVSDDPELAHSKEHDLYREFTRHIATRGPAPLRGMAKELLRVDRIEFRR